jgi:hypothetical protein
MSAKQPVDDRIKDLRSWMASWAGGTPGCDGALVVLSEIEASHAALLAAAEAVLASLSAGLGEIAEQGVHSPAFQSRSDETAAAFRDLKTAVAKARGA